MPMILLAVMLSSLDSSFQRERTLGGRIQRALSCGDLQLSFCRIIEASGITTLKPLREDYFYGKIRGCVPDTLAARQPTCQSALQGPVWCAGLRPEAAILPVELALLEVAIGDVCQLCSGLVKELESSGHPILDTLVKHVRPISHYTDCAIHSLQSSQMGL